MNHSKTRLLTLTGMFAALVFLTTAYLFHIPVGNAGGYVHIGDGIIYLAAAILPAPYAMAAGAIGAGLADAVSPGGAIWILPTVMIKPLIVFAFSRRGERVLTRRNLLGVLAGGCINTAGYAVAEGLMFGNLWAAVMGIPAGIFQFIGSGAFFLICAMALDRVGVKTRLTLPTR